MGCGFFSLLLRSKSGDSWSASLVHPLTQWLGAAAGADCAWPPVRHGGFWEELPFLRALGRAIRTWKSGLCLALVSFSPSVFGCCLWSTSYFGTLALLGSTVDTCLREAIGEFHIFSTCGELRSEAFTLHSATWRSVHSGCFELQCLFARFALLNLDIISTSSPCDGVGLTHFASFFALLRLSGVERQFFELSSAHNCECSRAPVGLPIHDCGAAKTLIASSEQQQHTTTHSNTQQHTATHSNTHSNTQQQHSNNTQQHTTTTHNNTQQHTTTNTQQPTHDNQHTTTNNQQPTDRSSTKIRFSAPEKRKKNRRKRKNKKKKEK